MYGLASLIHLWDPDCLALCGGVMQQSYPVEQLKALVPKSVMPAYRSVSIDVYKRQEIHRNLQHSGSGQASGPLYQVEIASSMGSVSLNDAE